MNVKQIILFILLTILLVVLSYLFLDSIDRHKGMWLTIVSAVLVIVDIKWMANLLQRVMHSHSSH